jgi:two-component system, NtrC family, sensor kinase
MFFSENIEVAYLFPIEKTSGLEEEYIISRDKDIITIGRHPNNNIAVTQEAISRHHARIERRGSNFVILDLNSSNGTFVNGQKVSQQKLEEGDIVTMGDIEFGFSYHSRKEALDEEESETTVSLEDEKEGEGESPFSTILTTKQTDSTPLPLADAAFSDKQELVKANQRLATLYRLSDLLRDARDQQTILERVINLIFEVLPADRGVILCREKDVHARFEPTIVKYRGDEPISQTSISISRTIVERSATEKIAILSRDARTDDRFKGSESIVMHDIRSAMCVPLIAKGKVLGVLHVDTRVSIRAFNEADLTFLSSLGNELAVSLDNLQMRELMVQQEKMAAIGQTIAGVAHNIKNILQLTMGGAQLMDKSLDDGNLENVRASWDIIKRGEDKIAKFIKDMLDFARKKSGQRKFCSTNDIIIEICDSVKDQLEKSNIKIKKDLDPNIPDRRLGEDGLYKCLMNLIINSSEAIKHGQGEITISTRLLENGDIQIEIVDNGEGIAPDNLKNLFVPFFTTKGSAGTGLGLCTTKKIIEENNGTISVDSIYGKGTTFIIIFISEDTKIGD